MTGRVRWSDLSDDEKAMAHVLGAPHGKMGPALARAKAPPAASKASGKARSTPRRVSTPREDPVWSPGTLPLAWQTIVRPERVLLHVSVPGRPVPKGRPRFNHNTGNVYTPRETVDGEEAWRWVARAARRLDGPSGRPAGILALFRLPDERSGDGDNLIKLVVDAVSTDGRGGPGVVLLNDRQVMEWHVHVLRSCSDPGSDVLIYEVGH